MELIHRVATLSVMVNRAAAAMRETDVIDQTHIRSTNYNATYARPHAYLQAYLRLSSEYRRYLALLKEHSPKPKPKKERPPITLAELLSPLEDPRPPAPSHDYSASDAELLRYVTPRTPPENTDIEYLEPDPHSPVQRSSVQQPQHPDSDPSPLSPSSPLGPSGPSASREPKPPTPKPPGPSPIAFTFRYCDDPGWP